MKLVRERVANLVRHYRYKVSVLSLTKIVIYAQVAHIDNDFIIFGDSGFSHLLIKDRKLRSIDEQFRKLFLIKYIPQIINSNVIKKDVRIIHSKEYGQIEYMALSRKIDERIVKMILRKIGSGNYHFWSIMDKQYT